MHCTSFSYSCMFIFLTYIGLIVKVAVSWHKHVKFSLARIPCNTKICKNVIFVYKILYNVVVFEKKNLVSCSAFSLKQYCTGVRSTNNSMPTTLFL